MNELFQDRKKYYNNLEGKKEICFPFVIPKTVVITLTFQNQILKQFYSGHSEISRMCSLMRSYVY